MKRRSSNLNVLLGMYVFSLDKLFRKLVVIVVINGFQHSPQSSER